jgi:hypothetical protein
MSGAIMRWMMQRHQRFEIARITSIAPPWQRQLGQGVSDEREKLLTTKLKSICRDC